MEADGEQQQGNHETHKKLAKECVENAPYNFPEGELDQEEDIKT